MNTLLPDETFHKFSFYAMGTPCAVEYSVTSPDRGKAYEADVLRWVEDFEAEFSRFRPDSLISRIAQAAGKERVPLSEEARSLFSLCDWFHWASRGVFDPSNLPLLRLWDYHQPNAKRPTDTQVAEAKALTGWKRVQHEDDHIFLPEEGMELDMGGIGKEYAVDRVMEMSEHFGIRNCLVNFGQDLRAKGLSPAGEPWRIGLENPLDPQQCWGGLHIHNRAVASSGDAHRFLMIDDERYGHILDTLTGFPVRNRCRSVTVIAPTCTQAGIFSTTAFILGLDAGMNFLEAESQVEGCICTETKIHCTPYFHEYLLP